MSVSNGQRANAQTFNDAFLSRTVDSDTTAVVGLNNPSSGGLIANAQQKINDNTAEIVSNDNEIATLFATKQDISEKGVANGYVPLNGSVKIDNIYLDDRIASIEGNWDANTNTPTLVDGVGNTGDIYVVNVAGTQDLGSGSQTFDIGDWIVYRASGVWQKTINSTAVTSVNGFTGAVSIGLDNLTDVNIGTPGPSDDQKALIYDDASGDFILGSPVGSGGSGGINYVINSDIELTADNHLTYNDGSVSEPVDGDGGVAVFSIFGRSTAAADAIRGSAVLNIGMTAGGNRQGQGVHIESNSIDERDKNQRLQVSFDYKHRDIVGNDYIDGLLKAFIYDVDNAQLIGALENDDNGDILRSTEPSTFVGFFNATNSANYRLLLHITSTTTNGWSMSYDNLKLGPVGFVPVTAQYSETIDLTGSGDFTGGALDIARVGNLVTVSIKSAITYAASSGVTSATGIIPTWAVPAVNTQRNIANTNGTVVQIIDVTTAGAISISSYNWSGVLTNSTSSNRGSVSYVVNGATNLVSNTELTQKTVRAKAKNSAGASTNNATPIAAWTESFDTHDSFNATTGVFTAPANGFYKVECSIYLAAANTTLLSVYVNGTQEVSGVQGTSSRSKFVSSVLELQKGDTVDFRTTSATTSTLDTVADFNHLSIYSLPDFTSYGVVNPNTEYLESILSGSVTTVSADTYRDTSLSIDLTPGTWDIGYSVFCLLTYIAGSNTVRYGNAAIRDSANNIIPDTLSSIGGNIGSAAGFCIRMAGSISQSAQLTVTEDITLKISIRINANAADATFAAFDSSFTAGLTNPDTSSKFWARRIK